MPYNIRKKFERLWLLILSSFILADIVPYVWMDVCVCVCVRHRPSSSSFGWLLTGAENCCTSSIFGSNATFKKNNNNGNT